MATGRATVIPDAKGGLEIFTPGTAEASNPELEVLCCDGDGKELVQWTTQGVVHNSPSVIKELAATAQLCSVQVGCTSPLHRRLTSRDSEPLAAQPVYWQGTRKSSKLVSIHVACRAAAEPQPAGRLPR